MVTGRANITFATNIMSLVGFQIAYIELILTYSKSQCCLLERCHARYFGLVHFYEPFCLLLAIKPTSRIQLSRPSN